ncbi:endonuclease/exonuclease/phosphatase family protein [Halocola ammonii]
MTLNLLFLVIWIFKKKWIFLVPLVSVALGLSYHQHFFQILGSEKPESKLENSVSVLSYNVRLFNLYHELDHITTRDSVLKILKAESADILCFQEFYYTAKKDGFDTRNKLLEELDNSYFHERYTHEFSGERYFGVATFSRYPIVQRGEIPFESDDNNYCIYTDIDVKGDTIRVFNTHLSSIRFGEEDYRFIANLGEERQELEEGGKRIAQRLITAYKKRQAQVDKIVKNIIRSPYPVVLCGDFNDTPISYTYSVVDEVLLDAFVQSGSGLGRTYNGPFPSFRIDYIWHDKNFESYNFKTLPLELSDHLPIRVDLAY